MISKQPLHQRLGWHLKQKHGGSLDFAWILNERSVGPHLGASLYWAKAAQIDQAPTSAVVTLIQGIFDRYQDLSFFLLRQRIMTTAILSEMDKGMIRVAAKRATGQIEVLEGEEPPGLVWIEVTTLEQPLGLNLKSGPLPSPEQIKAYLDLLKATVDRGPVLHDHNRPIAAVLIGSNGELLQESVHQGAVNKTWHAEVKLCQNYFRRHQGGFPEGSRLYTSLKPCRMCAGMIDQMSCHLQNFRTTYFEDDPGPSAKDSVLEKKGRLSYG